jgi:short subunit dehydrogenase-like uncharacterized protein
MTERSKSDKPWMIYGAYGYTGTLLAEEAKRRGETPVLAGRSEEKTREIAERLELPWRSFSLDDPRAIARELDAVGLVLHAAGPFSATSGPMVDACLATSTHYLDITGEIAVFEAAHARDADAREAGIVLFPGTGFDVVPSDCLAASLHAALPEATRLYLAISGGSSPSRGTMKSMVEGLGAGGAIRRGGRIERVPMGWKTRTVPFHDKPRLCVAIPWGDVSTAYHSTGIPDIEVYAAMPARLVLATKAIAAASPVLRLDAVQRMLKRRVDRMPEGPDEEHRRTYRSQLWGRVEDGRGRGIEGTLTTPEGYAHTVDAALTCAKRVLGGEVEPGFTTPSCAFGASFVTTLRGTELRLP